VPTPIYIHCAQGHGRTATIAVATLIAMGKVATIDAGLGLLHTMSPAARPNRAQREALERAPLRRRVRAPRCALAPRAATPHDAGAMKTIDRLGSFDQVIEGASEEVREICRALRALVVELHPDVVEVPRAGEGAAAYGFGEKKMSEAYAYIMPQKSYANLGLFHGATMAAAHPSLEGTGAKLRHVKVRDLASVRSPAVRSVLIDSIRERGAALGHALPPAVTSAEGPKRRR
jgi:hypothetical protein